MNAWITAITIEKKIQVYSKQTENLVECKSVTWDMQAEGFLGVVLV